MAQNINNNRQKLHMMEHYTQMVYYNPSEPLVTSLEK
jgi:hypothetical protein